MDGLQYHYTAVQIFNLVEALHSSAVRDEPYSPCPTPIAAGADPPKQSPHTKQKARGCSGIKPVWPPCLPGYGAHRSGTSANLPGTQWHGQAPRAPVPAASSLVVAPPSQPSSECAEAEEISPGRRLKRKRGKVVATMMQTWANPFLNSSAMFSGSFMSVSARPAGARAGSLVRDLFQSVSQSAALQPHTPSHPARQHTHHPDRQAGSAAHWKTHNPSHA
jgi:hypothetical protein